MNGLGKKSCFMPNFLFIKTLNESGNVKFGYGSLKYLCNQTQEQRLEEILIQARSGLLFFVIPMLLFIFQLHLFSFVIVMLVYDKMKFIYVGVI